MLSGTAPDAADARQGGHDREAVRPGVINSVSVLQPQQVMLEVRFIEASRQAGRELGVQWNAIRQRPLPRQCRQPQSAAGQLPVTPNGEQPVQAAGRHRPAAPNVDTQSLPISPVVAAGVLSGTAPFGFLIGR